MRATFSSRARAAALAPLACSVLALASCSGSATVSDDTSSASSIPEETTASSSVSSSASASGSESSSAASATDRDDAALQSQQAIDQGAREVESVEPQAVPLRPEDHDYLNALKDGGVKVEGVENQLIATGQDVCQAKQQGKQSYLVDAVAGQLEQQKRIDKPAEEVSGLIARSAEQAYC